MALGCIKKPTVSFPESYPLLDGKKDSDCIHKLRLEKKCSMKAIVFLNSLNNQLAKEY